MEQDAIAGRIKKLRMGLLAFRYLYYCQQQSIITDFEYDAREFELRTLVDAYPAIAREVVYDDECPTKTVGSDSVVDYADEIMDLAERLLYMHTNVRNGEVVQKCTTEELTAELERIVVQLKQPATQPGLFTS